MNSSSTLLPIVIVFAFVPRVAAAAEGYGNCTRFVDSLPAIIKAGSPGGYVYGIGGFQSAHIEGNTVWSVRVTSGSTGRATGICSSENHAGSISENRIRNVVGDGGSLTRGILALGASRLVLRNNDLVGDGSEGSTGLHCSLDTNRAIGNVINGFVTPIRVCANVSGNDVTP